MLICVPFASSRLRAFANKFVVLTYLLNKLRVCPLIPPRDLRWCVVAGPGDVEPEARGDDFARPARAVAQPVLTRA